MLSISETPTIKNISNTDVIVFECKIAQDCDDNILTHTNSQTISDKKKSKTKSIISKPSNTDEDNIISFSEEDNFATQQLSKSQIIDDDNNNDYLSSTSFVQLSSNPKSNLLIDDSYNTDSLSHLLTNTTQQIPNLLINNDNNIDLSSSHFIDDTLQQTSNSKVKPNAKSKSKAKSNTISLTNNDNDIDLLFSHDDTTQHISNSKAKAKAKAKVKAKAKTKSNTISLINNDNNIDDIDNNTDSENSVTQKKLSSDNLILSTTVIDKLQNECCNDFKKLYTIIKEINNICIHSFIFNDRLTLYSNIDLINLLKNIRITFINDIGKLLYCLLLLSNNVNKNAEINIDLTKIKNNDEFEILQCVILLLHYIGKYIYDVKFDIFNLINIHIEHNICTRNIQLYSINTNKLYVSDNNIYVFKGILIILNEIIEYNNLKNNNKNKIIKIPIFMTIVKEKIINQLKKLNDTYYINDTLKSFYNNIISVLTDDTLFQNIITILELKKN